MFLILVRMSKATSKREKQYTADYNNPASAFAKHVNVEDLKKFQCGLKTVGTCDYLQGLLRFCWEIAFKKSFNDANLFATEMCNTKIRKSILEQITVPDFAEVCKHLPSPDYSPYTQNTLFTTKNKWLTLNAIQEVSHRANVGFMNDEVVQLLHISVQ